MPPSLDFSPTTRLEFLQGVEHAIQRNIRTIRLSGPGISLAGEPHRFAFSELTERHSGLHLIGTDEHPFTINLQGRAGHGLVIHPGTSIRCTNLRITGGQTIGQVSALRLPNWQRAYSVYAALDGAGVLVLAGAKLELKDCVIDHNHAIMCGGGLSNQGGTLEIHNCTVANNTALDTGGGVDNLVAGSILIMTECTLVDNRSDLLGAHRSSGEVSLFPDTYSKLTGNHFFASRAAPAIDWQLGKGSAIITGNTFSLLQAEPTDAPLDEQLWLSRQITPRTSSTWNKRRLTHSLRTYIEQLRHLRPALPWVRRVDQIQMESLHAEWKNSKPNLYDISNNRVVTHTTATPTYLATISST